MVEILGAAVPEFSAMLFRKRLVGSFVRQSPPLTLICGAAGYGKTVLASQLALLTEFDTMLWVQIPDIDVTGDFILRQVADTFDQRCRQSDDVLGEGVRSLDPAALGDSVRIRDYLQQHHGSRVLVVIDGANALSDLNDLTALAADLGRCTSPGSRLVACCRRFDQDGPVDSGTVWLIEEEDLAFTMCEMRALVSGVCTPDPENDAIRLYESCSGHPAITRIMLRHGILVPDARPRDLIWQTERIVSRLDEAAIAALYLAAVLGEGNLATLQGCALRCDLRAEWRALSRSVPLFYILDAAQGAQSFRVHAILSDVLNRLARREMSAEDRSSVRGVAFEQLSRERDYVRLASALELYGTEDELARWCECDGFSLLRYTNHSVIARLLARLSPLSVASSARLLLLRAYVQRAAGAPSSAVEAAKMAKRVAEVACDDGNRVMAVLLIARLQFDQGLIAESQRMLEDVESRHGVDEDVAVRSLTQAYLAVCDGQAGRLRSAMERIGLLTRMAKHLDQGSDEAVFIANCVGAVACHCAGDWAAAATVLAPIARRADVAPLQQVHIRSNYAVALFELGDLRESMSRAEDVTVRCASLGIASMLSCATAALSDMHYAGGDPSRARELSALAMEAFERMHDYFSLASHGINSARALRALGEYEESLSNAASAESLLANHGASAHMLRLMASIEVAASHLALGDVPLASSTVERVLADPVVAEALGHRLRCDLVRAEIDRIRGDWPSAVQRLVSYSQYIAGGSANMTLACYIRAFPGLLGILDQALGDAGVPTRVTRLLPGATIADALTYAQQSVDAGFAAVMQRKYAFAEPAAECPVDGDPQTTDDTPFLHVRAFGKLEIESSYGRVEHRHWRKRKSRLLFLMLLCAPAHEIPRDVILERLWPDMARANAQRNLYVTWSHLRKALACETEQEDIGLFAGSSLDACWLTDLLQSDL
ncbi:MAG: AAA family ATPase, partial [Thiobacillus sp.]